MSSIALHSRTNPQTEPSDDVSEEKMEACYEADPVDPMTETPSTNALDRTISIKSSKSWKDPGPPPDGGLNAWTQAAMGHLVTFNTWGYINSFGVFQTYYVEHLGHSPSDISWVGSTQVFLLFLIGAISGRALDAGYFYQTFYLGFAVFLVGIFTTSAAEKYWELFLAQGVCTGVGMGIMFTPAIAVVSTYFAKRKAFALSILSSGTATGGIIFPLIVQQLLPRIGFGWTVRVIGFIALAIGLVTCALLKPRVPPRKSAPLVDWASFKDLPFMLYCTGCFFGFWALLFAFYYIGAYGREVLGFSYSESINLLLITNAVGVPGRLIPALLSDLKFGPLNVISVFIFFSAIILYCWHSVDSKVGLYLFGSFYGLIAPGLTTLWPTGLASLTKDLQKTGTRIGMGFALVSVACLCGPPVGGALIQEDDGKYLYAQMWAASSWVVCLLFLVSARIAKTGFVLRIKT